MTTSQQKIVRNLRVLGITDPQKIVEYCNAKMLLPRARGKKGEFRKYPLETYRGVIEYFSS